MTQLSRRQFLRRGALLAAGGLAMSPTLVYLSEEMVKLQPRKTVFIPPPPVLATVSEFGETPITLPDGRKIIIRDFSESDKYDSVVIPSEHGMSYMPAVWGYAVSLMPTLQDALAGAGKEDT